jgi:hypothetical protein
MCLLALELNVTVWLVVPVPVVVLAILLWLVHWFANAEADRLVEGRPCGPVSANARETHCRLSLEATSADIAVIVTMAVALFIGFYNAMTNFGSISDSLPLEARGAVFKRWGVPLTSGYALMLLLLSARMIVRLRIALADHSQSLADLRGDADEPWRFRFLERTLMLFLIVLVFAGLSAMILFWTWTGGGWAVAAGAVVLGLGSAGYVMSLRRAAAAGNRKKRRS